MTRQKKYTYYHEVGVNAPKTIHAGEAALFSRSGLGRKPETAGSRLVSSDGLLQLEQLRIINTHLHELAVRV